MKQETKDYLKDNMEFYSNFAFIVALLVLPILAGWYILSNTFDFTPTERKTADEEMILEIKNVIEKWDVKNSSIKKHE